MTYEYPINLYKGWYNNFINKNGGYDYRKNSYNHNSFINKWQTNHESLIAALDGWTKTVEINVDIPARDLTTEEIRAIFTKCDLQNHLNVDLLSYCKSEYTMEGNYRPRKNTRYILELLNANNVPVASANKVISLIGEAWKNASKINQIVNVIVSCDPREFIMLGHNGPVDKKSCFSQTGSNSWQKYALALNYNSFIIKCLGKDDEIEFRAFGEASLPEGMACGIITNMYFSNTSKTSLYMNAAQKAIKEVFGDSVITSVVSENGSIYGPDENGVTLRMGNKVVYVNSPESKILFYHKDIIKDMDKENPIQIDYSTVADNISAEQGKTINQDFTCPMCGKVHPNLNGWNFVDGDKFVCPNCVSKAVHDVINDKYITTSVVNVISLFGDIVPCEEKYAKKNFEICQLTNDLAQRVVNVKYKNKTIKACPDSILFKKTFIKNKNGGYITKE